MGIDNHVWFVIFLMASLVSGMLMINISSAEEQHLGTFKQYSCVNLIQICGNCTFNNITSVLYPNSSAALGQVIMTKSGTHYNYTFCSTSLFGTYIVNGVGNDDAVNTVWSYDFAVTPSEGAENNTTTFIILIAVSFVLLGFSLFMKNHVIAFFAGLMLSVTGVYSTIYGFGNITNTYTQMISWLFIGLGAIITIVSAFEFMGEMEGNTEVEYEDD